jgi:hypothetical protein
MQVVQYTSNMYYDSNKYINKIDTYKYVTRHIYLCLYIIFYTQYSFLCEVF